MFIGIDIDDTITNTAEMLLAFAQKYDHEELKRNTKLEKEKAIVVHGFSTLKNAFNWTEENVERYKTKYQDYIGEHNNIKPLAKETLKKLREEGHTIILITARGIDEDRFSDPYEITKKMLYKNDIPYDKLIVRCKDKVVVCKENNIDVFIDDRESHCKQVSAAGTDTIIMTGPHNMHIEDESIDRAYSWVDIYYKIQERNDSNG